MSNRCDGQEAKGENRRVMERVGKEVEEGRVRIGLIERIGKEVKEGRLRIGMIEGVEGRVRIGVMERVGKEEEGRMGIRSVEEGRDGKRIPYEGGEFREGVQMR